MHAIDIHRQAHNDNRYEHMRAEVDEYITRNKAVGRNKLVLGIDLTTTLVPGWEGLTGSNLMTPKDGHNEISQDKAMELMEAHDLVAFQTQSDYTSDDCIWTRKE